MKLEWFAMPKSNSAPKLVSLFPRTMSKREEHGKNQITVFFFTM